MIDATESVLKNGCLNPANAVKAAAPHADSILARSFNLGSDARLAGVKRSDNPCHDAEKEYWDHGWHHVDIFWAVDTKWPTPFLPKVGK